VLYGRLPYQRPFSSVRLVARQWTTTRATPEAANDAGERRRAYTVARVFMMRQQQMLSTGGCPRDTSIGAASATGVPNPEHPSIMYANAQPIRKTSATGWPEDSLRTLAIIQGRHCRMFVS
jgi:hypothetical protein